MDFHFLTFAKTYKQPHYRHYHKNDPWLMDNVYNTANFHKHSSVIPLYVRYKLVNTTHLSLAHLWNDWYKEYFEATFPRLLVRMEDLLFHAEQVVQQVCTCVGGSTTSPKQFQYITDSAKHGAIHGTDKTNLVTAMIRYGNSAILNRTNGMTNEDQDYAQHNLDKQLMRLFGYQHPNDEIITS
jgi:hypothetical protein